MSSIDQDRRPAEGSEPDLGTRRTLLTARGTSSRVVGPRDAERTSDVPTQRQGKARRTRTFRGIAAVPTSAATGEGSTLARAKAATAKVATARVATAKVVTAKVATARVATAKVATAKVATARVATAKVATAKVATAKVATAKAAAAARSAAVTAVANRTAGVRNARAEAGARAAAGSGGEAPAVTRRAASAAPLDDTRPAVRPATTAAEPPAAEPAAAAPVVRPTPHKRVPAAAEATSAPVPPSDGDAARPAGTPDAVVPADSPALTASPPGSPGRPSALLRRRTAVVRPRPAICLSAAVVGAIALGAFTDESPAAQPTAPQSQSVSVAEQLGIEADSTALLAEDATERLGELAVSRNARDAEQAAAAHVQMEADRIAAEAAAAAAAAAAEAARPKAVPPVDGARLTSGFGPRWGTLHAGIDLAAPMRTPEHAVLDGVVLEAGPASGFGLAVYIQHENGDVTVYGHMDEILVQAGQVVRAGDTIALLGNRGQSTGPHLHFEVHVGGLDGQKTDPLPWLRGIGVDI